MMIRRATPRDIDSVTGLAMKLFPDHEEADLRTEMSGFVDGAETAVFLSVDGDSATGFAQCALRHDYVEGTDSTPVGYLEGVYVEPDCRRSGVANALVEAGIAWAKSMGCHEFASDCELSNTQSIAFHKGIGFAEANRIVCFVREI